MKKRLGIAILMLLFTLSAVSYMVNEAMGVDPNYGFGTAVALIIFAFALLLTSLYQLAFGRRMEGGEC